MSESLVCGDGEEGGGGRWRKGRGRRNMQGEKREKKVKRGGRGKREVKREYGSFN